MPVIGLLRHFPTEWNARGLLQGRSDQPLSADSRAALARLRLPPAWRAARVVSSPLARARQTAEALSETGPPRLDPDLVEMDFGAWEGCAGAALLADPLSGYRPVEEWGWDFAPPGGETPRAMARRLAPALARLAAEAAEAPRLVVAHRGVMRCILALASGWPYRGPEPFRIKRAAVHPVTLADDGRPLAFGAPVKLTPRLAPEAGA
ncbi:histidine phosphatase family protein [Oceanicella actignis]|uniref:Probable phosphoglycerate mutase n=1 Tax=Oceanicella actignis TaxID=1189325 RepID=A0A1M7TNF3_9RHOB|nr:histidine phosphatase family protein [Oceanicella actignis]TYO85207.1 putative phosphoglycerate mutase [Oceanicella actignis]SET72602.1 probable phosphoglycerate mutase [Oceanicella actignis]SHN72274.1 probable phosphoglycerate mutase [Oceanicella actignis]